MCLAACIEDDKLLAAYNRITTCGFKLFTRQNGELFSLFKGRQKAYPQNEILHAVDYQAAYDDFVDFPLRGNIDNRIYKPGFHSFLNLNFAFNEFDGLANTYLNNRVLCQVELFDIIHIGFQASLTVNMDSYGLTFVSKKMKIGKIIRE